MKIVNTNFIHQLDFIRRAMKDPDKQWEENRPQPHIEMSPTTKIAIDGINKSIDEMKAGMKPTNGELAIMIDNLCKSVESGFNNIRSEQKIAFKGVHTRQDKANHGIQKNREGLEEYKKDKVFIDELKEEKKEKKKEIRTIRSKVIDYSLRALVFGTVGLLAGFVGGNTETIKSLLNFIK